MTEKIQIYRVANENYVAVITGEILDSLLAKTCSENIYDPKNPADPCFSRCTSTNDLNNAKLTHILLQISHYSSSLRKTRTGLR